MFRYIFALQCIALATAACGVSDANAADGNTPPRPLKIVVARDAPAPVREAAQRVVSGIDASPVLKVMADHQHAELISSDDLAKARPEDRAFAHLILVGLPDDAMIKLAWQRDARMIRVGNAAGLYVFGFGNLLGDVGYVESGRNPFLHGAGIKTAPYEAETITLSGSTAGGVVLATDAFLKQGLLNGVVADQWRRGETTLLDRDPLKPATDIPDVLSPQLGRWIRVGITQPGEDEYRAVLNVAGIEPAVIWRTKYYAPGIWDGSGDPLTMRQFSEGLQRRSYGNTLWVARFSTAPEASAAATKIAAAAHLKSGRDGWIGQQTPFASEKSSPGPITLHCHGQWLEMSTVPAE